MLFGSWFYKRNVSIPRRQCLLDLIIKHGISDSVWRGVRLQPHGTERARDGISSKQFALQSRKLSPRQVDSLSKVSRGGAGVTRQCWRPGHRGVCLTASPCPREQTKLFLDEYIGEPLSCYCLRADGQLVFLFNGAMTLSTRLCVCVWGRLPRRGITGWEDDDPFAQELLRVPFEKGPVT